MANQKKTHFGRAGEYLAMSELLLRGWNVAVPVVDVGDDVFVIDDADKRTLRLQVKSAEAAGDGTFRFKLSRSQLARGQPIELCYMFMLRLPAKWRFLVIPRAALYEVRRGQEQESGHRRGRPMVSDEKALGDALAFKLELRGDEVTGWGRLLSEFLDTWPKEIPQLAGGPGATAVRARGASTAPREAIPAPPPGPRR